MNTITKRQKEILQYISSYIDNKGYSPTFDEIKEEFGLSALSTVHEHITALVNKGRLGRDEGKVRGLYIPKRIRPYLEIPLVGTITAGEPIEAVEIPNETVRVAREPNLKGNLFSLKVKGDSMIEEGIFDGDIVIVKKQEMPDNGDTVVAIIDDNEATLKRFYKENDKIRLQPANPEYNPIYRKEVEIRGVVVKIIRNF